MSQLCLISIPPPQFWEKFVILRRIKVILNQFLTYCLAGTFRLAKKNHSYIYIEKFLVFMRCFRDTVAILNLQYR